MQKTDLTGTVISYYTIGTETRKNGKKAYTCLCICGVTKIVEAGNLRTAEKWGKTASCGCMKAPSISKTNTKHGQKNTRLYTIWAGMKARANNTRSENSRAAGKDVQYLNNNICICNEWLNFTPFYKWAIYNGYNDSLTIDRIDNLGDYTPSNCQWITTEENSSKDSLGVSNQKCRKLTNDDILVVRELLSNDVHQTDIARRFNVDRTTISNVKLGKCICYQ